MGCRSKCIWSPFSRSYTKLCVIPGGQRHSTDRWLLRVHQKVSLVRMVSSRFSERLYTRIRQRVIKKNKKTSDFDLCAHRRGYLLYMCKHTNECAPVHVHTHRWGYPLYVDTHSKCTLGERTRAHRWVYPHTCEHIGECTPIYVHIHRYVHPLCLCTHTGNCTPILMHTNIGKCILVHMHTHRQVYPIQVHTYPIHKRFKVGWKKITRYWEITH